jgi:pre-mRNA-splicing factor CWC26
LDEPKTQHHLNLHYYPSTIMSLADYLAKNYLTADSPADKKSKKRKRKTAESTTDGLVIADESEWASSAGANNSSDNPLLPASNSAKTKKGAWRRIGASVPSNAEQAAADAILAAAEAERKAAEAAEDEAPQILEEDGDDEDDAVRMESGVRAGLQTGAQVAADLKRKADAERKRYAEMDPEASGRGQETIYRDASGRVVNVAMKRAEARKKAEEDERKKRDAAEAAKGDVQRLEKEARKQRLEDAKFMTVARYADDAELNEELKDQARWNDPAAGFVKEKKSGRSKTGKPLYKGTAAPNRYGIRPGYRWDGVDRSNGFEKEYFAAQNRKANLKNLQYAWEMDD